MKKEKLAIFDLDGTLFDTRDVNYHAYKKALKEYGYTLDYQFFCKDCNGRHYKDFLPLIVSGDMCIVDMIHKAKIELYQNYLKFAKPNYHLINIARLIRSEYYTAIVTTASKNNCLQLLGYFSVTNYFDHIYSQEDISKAKPNPEGFVTAMNDFGIEPENTVIFEDSDAGITAAKFSGADFFVVKNYR